MDMTLRELTYEVRDVGCGKEGRFTIVKDSFYNEIGGLLEEDILEYWEDNK